MELQINGHPSYAYTGGKAFDAALPTVVFIHGAQNDHSVWILQSRYLAHHGYGVLAWDLRGHGRSQGPVLAVPTPVSLLPRDGLNCPPRRPSPEPPGWPEVPTSV